MSAFDDLFRQNGWPLMGNHFGNCVTYCKFDGTERVVTAVIDRNPPTTLDGVEYAITDDITISVKNCNQTGIASSELDVGGDSVLIPKRDGKQPQRMSIVALDEDTGGTCIIRLR